MKSKTLVGTTYNAYKVIYKAGDNYQIAFFTDPEGAESFAKLVNGKMLKEANWKITAFLNLDEWGGFDL